jgi:hypothetical protein
LYEKQVIEVIEDVFHLRMRAHARRDLKTWSITSITRADLPAREQNQRFARVK